MKQRKWLLGAVALLVAVPLVQGVPEVRDSSLATVFVDDTDYFEFDSGFIPGGVQPVAQTGVTITVTSPSGNSFSLTHPTPTESSQTTTRFYMTGANPSTGSNEWIRQGALTSGEPADGTWLIRHSTGQFLGPVLISVGGKGFTTSWIFTTFNNPNLWNWHITPAGTVDSDQGNVIFFNTFDDFVDPEEDPNNARFFSDVAGPDVSPFTAYTLNAVVTCTAVPTMTITGAWLGADGTAFSSHIYRDGNFVGTPDLRSIAFAVTTTEENEGATPAGTDTEAAIPYNNAAGTSYQFRIRTDAQGEMLGVVAWAPPLQCTPASAPGLLNANNNVLLSVSQAQCANDVVSFSIDVDLSVAVALNDIELEIHDAQTGVLLANYDEAQMFTTQAGQILYMADVFGPGAYMAHVVADVGGVGAVDQFDSEAFNVPVGDCIWREPDLSNVYARLDVINNNVLNANSTLHASLNASLEAILAAIMGHNETMTAEHANNLAIILAAIQDHDLNMTLQHELLNATLGDVLTAIDNIEINFDFSGNNTFIIDNATLQAILDNLTVHRTDSLEVMGMSFDTLGFDGLLLTLAWMLALIWCLLNAKLLAAGIATIGAIVSSIAGIPDWIQLWSIVAFIIALWLEATLRDRIYQRWFNSDSKRRET